MDIPKWASVYLDEKGFLAVESAVQQAEAKTSGELVPVIVRRSSTIGHVPIILILFFSLLFFVLEGPYWQHEWFDLPLWMFVVGDLLILAGLVRLLAPLPFVERLLTSKYDQMSQVEQRAINEFYNHNIRDTKGATGILIFVSLMEHQAVVLGDHAIAEKLSTEDWQGVVDRLIRGIKEKDMADGFCQAIAMSGELLKTHFPIQNDDINELQNGLIIKD